MRFAPLSLLAAALLLAGCGSSSHPTASNSAPTRAKNHVHSIAILPTNPNVLYMGAHYRMYKSTDGGRNWTPMTSQMMLSMVLDPAHPTTLYAVSNTKGLQKSTDGGKNWHLISAGVPHGSVVGVSFDPASRAVFAYGNGLYRSTDAGAHWKNVLPGKSIANMAASRDGTLYAATGVGLYVSHDGGNHWKVSGAVGNQPIIQIVASAGTAYAVAPVSMLKSTDDGHMWKTLSRAPAGIEFAGVAPTDPNEVFVEVGGSGFYASHDGGLTWQRADKGITDRNFNASTIQVAPSSPQVVYTGAWGLHFYASHDGGRHWQRTAVLTT